MTCREQEEDLAPDEASGVLCRCGHLLTDSDLHFCGYCGSVIQVTRGRRQAPAAVVSGRRAALAALASERNAVPAEPVLAEPVTDRFVAPPVRALHPLPPPPSAPVVPAVTVPAVTVPAVTVPAVTAPAVTPPAPPPAPAPTAAPSVPAASAALAAAALAEAAESALTAAPAAPVASATRAAKAAKAARTPRTSKPARVARGGGVTTTPAVPDAAPAPAAPAPAPAAPARAAAAPAAPAPAPAPIREPEADTPSPSPTAPPTDAPAAGPVPAGAVAPPTTDADHAGDEPGPEAAAAVAPETSVLGRRNWTGLLALLVVLGACAVRTGLGLLFTYPGYLSWLPIVLVAAVALLKVARFSIGLVGAATAVTAAWWVVDHVASTARLQSLGYDIGQSTIAVPGLVAAIGSVPLAVVLCAVVDGHVRASLRAWVVPAAGPSPVRAAAVVLAVLAAVFPVAGSLSTQPGFAALTAARDQVRYPGYPTPGEIADRMHAMSVSKGRPVSMTCTYAPDDGAARPTYQCVGISQVGSEAAQVHDGIRSTALPDGTYSCVDLTSGVDRRLC